MLTQIYIKNFVIVDELNLNFSANLNVLTGETGAGKSIWVDAVLLALGARADHNPVRENQKQCNITLCFDLSSQPMAQAWLREHDFDTEEDCIISRTITDEGKSRSSLNGQPCSQHLIKELASHLVLTHSQHQHQALLKREMQRQQLDAFAGNDQKIKKLSSLFSQWQQIQDEIQQLKAQSPNKEDELKLLHYQYNELTTLALEEDEWQSLSDEHQRCFNAKSLIDHVDAALELTIDNEQHSAAQLVQQAISQLQDQRFNDQVLDDIREMLNTAAIHLQEAGSSLNSYRNQLDLSPEKLHALESRIQLIHDIARKHHCPPEQLNDTKTSLEQKIATLENSDLHLETLQQTELNVLNQYQKQAQSVSRSRHKHAAILSEKVTTLMQQLGMEGGQFSIQLATLDGPIHPYGQEQVEYHVSTNVGQTPQAMTHIVSGGELSRISLALQVITAEYCKPPTLIFDEVDVGIGGTTADTVGELLKSLSQNQQVLCITHLAQIAAKGQRHFQISKKIKNKLTISQVMQLKKEERVKEIARMLGGQTKTSQAHAISLLQTQDC